MKKDMRTILKGGLAALFVLAAVGFSAGTGLMSSIVVYDESGSAPSCATMSTSLGWVCAENGIESESALNVAGASTLTGAVTITGALSVAGGTVASTGSITTTTTLTAADCGEIQFVTAGIDTKSITLPATSAGCVYTFMYVGADGGALLDISPNASDAVHGSCTLAASVLEFSGTDDADIGLTKATANTGDTITLAGDGTEGWYVTTCTGIWANN